MYPNLLGQKMYRHMSNDDMAKIINVSRNTFDQKIKTGRFTPNECKKYCLFFNKSFAYLFATDQEIAEMDKPQKNNPPV